MTRASVRHTNPPFICFAGLAPTLGDVAIGQSILEGLRARTGLPLRIHTGRPAAFRALPGIGGIAELRPPLPEFPVPALRSPAFPYRLQALVRDLRQTGGARVLPPARYSDLRDALFGCAGLVFQGGPSWNDRMVDRRRALDQLLLLEAARHYGVPVYHVGVSCGPFRWGRPARWWMVPLCRRALDLYDTLFVRDRFSRPALERLGVSATVVESTDAAVFLASRRDPAFAPVEHRIHAGSSRRRVVVCVRDFQPAYPAAVGVRARVWRTLAAVLDRVQRDLADVFFLSTDHIARPEKQTDVEVAEGIQRMMTTRGSTVIDVEVQNPAALKHIYGQFDAMISMRLHPTILALDHGVPCLLLAYDDKCDDFFGSLDLQEFALPLAAFEYGAAMPTIERLLGSSHLRDRIRARFARLKSAHAADYEPMYERIAARAGHGPILAADAAGGLRTS